MQQIIVFVNQYNFTASVRVLHGQSTVSSYFCASLNHTCIGDGHGRPHNFFPGGGRRQIHRRSQDFLEKVDDLFSRRPQNTSLTEGCTFFLKKVDDLFFTVKTQVLTVTSNAQNTLHHFQGGASAPPPCPCPRAPIVTVPLLLTS